MYVCIIYVCIYLFMYVWRHITRVYMRNYKDTPVHGQSQAPVYTTCIAQSVHAKYCRGTSTACESKHAGHRTIGTSPRLSMPNTVRVQVERASPSTRARSVYRPGCPCHKLYECKYNVRTQARGESLNDWGELGYDDSVPVEVTKTAPSGDRTT